MPSTTAQKLKIREAFTLLTLHAPQNFEKQIDGLPDKVKMTTSGKSYDQIHWFVRNRAEMERDVETVVALLKDDVICWIHYPKGSSKLQTDLTRDKGWDSLLRHKELQWISLISFDETWSTFGMRLQTAADKKKTAKPAVRPIFDYIDAVAKTIRIPEDLAAAFQNAKEEESFFQGLSFTNRKEYVEWIVSAKREETRTNRVKETTNRLSKGWKNPANR